MSQVEKSVAAFVLSLVAGLSVLLASGITLVWVSRGMPIWNGMMGGMMSGWQGMMGGMGMFGGMFLGSAVLGLISGVIIIVGAFALYMNPNQASTWGTIIVIFSFVGGFGMGGFFIGSLLGIVGGLLALTGKRTS